MAGEIPIEDCSKYYLRLFDISNQLDERMIEFQAELYIVIILSLRQEICKEEANDFYDHWDDFDHTQKSDVAEQLVFKINLSDEGISSKFAYQFATPSNTTPTKSNLSNYPTPLNPQHFSNATVNQCCLFPKQNICCQNPSLPCIRWKSRL
jgi:hypothetical protein